jgi:hypothetical protein
MVSQKAAARSSKTSLKPKKLSQISETKRKDKQAPKSIAKQSSFDKEINGKKKVAQPVRSSKENQSRTKFKAKNKSKSRHKKRR